MNLLRQKLEALEMVFERLSSREKVLVMGATSGLIVFIVMFVSFFINSSLKSLEDRVETKRDSYQSIQRYKQKFEIAKLNIENLKKQIRRNNDNRISQIIGEQAEKNGVTITQMSESGGAIDKKSKTREVKYKVDVKKAELGPLLAMLRAIENQSDLVFIKTMNMKRRYNNKSEIDVTFYVSTIVSMDDEG